MAGPLEGVRIVEFAGLGAAPFAAMMLGDMGADVVRIDRPPVGDVPGPYPVIGTRYDVMARSRRSIALDLKKANDRKTALDLAAKADGLLEGFRPGVMERLGLGPDECHAVNPRLVYARVTGWGQTGPLAQSVGHDINYIALSGLLPSVGRPGTPPPPPLNLIGDFGGGGMLAAFGMACGLLHAASSGKGQVVDCAMLDGSALLAAMMYGFKAMGGWSHVRGRNWVDGGAPYYDTYECADGKLIAIGPIEPNFYATLLALCGIEDEKLQEVSDIDRWPEQKAVMADIFATRSRAAWCELLEGTDACFSPVLDLHEAPEHAHNRARGNFIELAGVIQPAPAPRFSGTPGAAVRPPPEPGADRQQVLQDWGVR